MTLLHAEQVVYCNCMKVHIVAGYTSTKLYRHSTLPQWAMLNINFHFTPRIITAGYTIIIYSRLTNRVLAYTYSLAHR